MTMTNHPMIQNILTEQLSDRMFRDRKVRRAITCESHLFFFHFYFAHYVTCETAPFHFELFRLTEDESIKNLVVVAFRGSGKSTLMTMSYPLWAILGKQQKKFVLILCQTRSQAKQHMMNVKRELEGNVLLKNDLGPFQEESDEWGSTSLVFSRLNARITTASTEQSIRGLRHHQHRPDVIIGDDLEDLASTRTHEARQKTYDWLMGEVLPAGSPQTRLILIGNFLHEDALLPCMKQQIDKGNIKGIFRAYPLVNDNNKISWPGMYPTQESIEELRRKEGEEAYQREYLLKIIPSEGQIVHPDWIRHYDELPPLTDENFRYIATAIDPAISSNDNACKTAMVSARVYGYEEEMRVYILPHPINEKLTSLETIEKAKTLSTSLTSENHDTFLYVEDVAYQKSLIEQLKKDGFPAEGVTVYGQDKAERLRLVSFMIQAGQVLFPRNGAEELIQQITGFGVERYNDLADAFSLLSLKIMKNNKQKPIKFVNNLRVEDFYRRSSGPGRDWADEEDARILGRINRGRGPWRRIYG